MSMKPYLALAFILLSFLVTGCAHTVPPHQEVNQALQKTLDSTGYNYSSRSRITNLTVPVKELKVAESKQLYLEKGIEIIRGLSINADGAIDLKTQKSEALYNLHYDRDNLEVSIKVPLLLDYQAQTLYVGTTLLNTLFPLPPANKGKLIKIDLADLLQLTADKSDKLNKLFTKKNVDSMHEGFKKGILKGVADLKDERFTDLPLTPVDKAAGVVRHISIKLNHDESIALFLTMADSLVQRLYQDGLLTKEEYGILMILTDKQKIESYLTTFSMAVELDVALESSGRINRIESRLTAVGKDTRYQIGLENISGFSNYNTPLFLMRPELTGTVDYKEILEAIKAAKTAQKSDTAVSEPPKEKQQLIK